MKKKIPSKKKTKEIYRIDFDTSSRNIIEVYDISPNGEKVRTAKGWVPSARPDVICQRPPRGGFVTKDQIDRATVAEKDFLKEKKYSNSAEYIVAKKYPIKEWMESDNVI